MGWESASDMHIEVGDSFLGSSLSFHFHLGTRDQMLRPTNPSISES